MLAQAHTRTTATHEQKSAKLLPTYPEQIAATLTPRQVRAALAGQHYYLDHQNGKHLSHTDLSAWLQRKSKQWRRARTSTEWQTYFMSGWYAALLCDPTAEKEHIAVPTILAGGEDDDENNRFPLWKETSAVFGFDFAPIKAGEPTAQIARPTVGRDTSEERRPSFDPEDYEDFGWSLKRFPLWGQNGGTFTPSSALKTLKNSATWPIFPLWGQNGGTFNSLAETPLFGAQGFGHPSWSRIQLAPEGGDGSGWSIRPYLFAGEDGDDGGWSLLFGQKSGGTPRWSLLFGPEDDRGGGWSLLFGPTGGDDETWKLPVFGPEDGDEIGWSLVFGPNGGDEPGWRIAGPHDGEDDTWGRAPLPPFSGDRGPQYIALCRTRRPMFSDEDDDDVKRAPYTHEGTAILAQCPSFGGEGDSDGEGFSPHSSLAPEDPTCDAPIHFAPDDETEERCPSFGEEAEDGGYRPRTRPLFMCIDDDDEDRSPSFGGDEMDERGGWYRSRLPRYLASRLGGGATLLPVSPLDAHSRPILPTEPADGDGDERCPCFPLGAYPVGRPTWPDDDDGNTHSPRTLTRWEGATWL